MDEITLNRDRMRHLCDYCARGRNCINGRWCLVARKYMEHNKLWICDNFLPPPAAEGDDKSTDVSQHKERDGDNENDKDKS